MLLPIAYGNFFACIGVAVFAQVRAGVVLANVLADNATTECPLAFILVIAFLDDFIFRIEQVSLYNFYSNKIHQLLVCREVFNHQIVVNTFVVNYAKRL